MAKKTPTKKTAPKKAVKKVIKKVPEVKTEGNIVYPYDLKENSIVSLGGQRYNVKENNILEQIPSGRLFKKVDE